MMELLENVGLEVTETAADGDDGGHVEFLFADRQHTVIQECSFQCRHRCRPGNRIREVSSGYLGPEPRIERIDRQGVRNAGHRGREKA